MNDAEAIEFYDGTELADAPVVEDEIPGLLPKAIFCAAMLSI